MSVGDPFDRHFEIRRPSLEAFDPESLLGHSSLVLFHAEIGLELRAQAVASDGALLFLASPRVSAFQEVKAAGLRLDDFASHEGVTEQLFALHTQQRSLSEARRFAERLSDQKRELRQLNLRLEAEMAEVHRARSESERLERRVKEAERLERLGVLAGGVAHDFNNLLVPIVANAEWLRSDEDPVDRAKSADEILEAAEMAKKLCQQMLSYAGRHQVQLEPLELGPFVEEHRSQLERAAGPRALKFELSGWPKGFCADAEQVRQVISNLVQNAAEACQPPQGQIVVRAASFDPSVHPFDADVCLGEIDFNESYAYLEVEDNGVGMGGSTLERAFDPFFSTKRMGRGLGMAVVFGIVRRHEGVLMVRSAPNQGTTVRILLPVPTAHPVVTRGEVQEDWSPSGKQVLLVDDDPRVRAVAERMLARQGFEIASARDGSDALSMSREIGHDLSLVLLDLSMPGVDGDRVYRDLREKWPGLPVVLMSGYAPERVGDLFGSDPHAYFLQKPFTTAGLVEAMKQVQVGAPCTA